MYEVEFYQDRHGREPIKEFLLELERQGETSKNARILADKIYAYIRMLTVYGTRAGSPYVKHLEHEIWELRPNRERILFFSFQHGRFILLHHFMKKTQKTPKKEIEQAYRNMQDYLKRSTDDGQHI